MQENNELRTARQKCYNLVEMILNGTSLGKSDIYWALAIRMGIPPEKCYVKYFSLDACNRAIKELKYMLNLLKKVQ